MTKKISKTVPTTASAVPPNPAQVKQALRKYVENFYDFQERRLQAEGRTLPKAKSAPIVLHEVDIIRLEHQVNALKAAEKAALTDVAFALKRIPFYNEILSDKVRYRGLGPTLAGVILSSFDIHREEMVSQMWSFAGLAPTHCKRCNTCQGEVKQTDNGDWVHVQDWFWKKSPCALKTVDSRNTYDSGKSMTPIKGEKLKYNKWLRAKLCGVLGGCLIKSKSPWADFYYNYKNRKIQARWGRSDNHRHKAAIRYMVKMLLLDIWKEWRTFEGLSVRQSYQEQYLGHTHHATQTSVGTPEAVHTVSWKEEDDDDEEDRLERLAVDEELAIADMSIDELAAPAAPE